MRIKIDISRHDAPLRLPEASAAQRLQDVGAMAALAVDGGCAVQDVPYGRLADILRREGHVTGR